MAGIEGRRVKLVPDPSVKRMKLRIKSKPSKQHWSAAARADLLRIQEALDKQVAREKAKRPPFKLED
jgi:hypothetical protein